jgi:membrane associated rhomboid family serine protease
MNDFKYRPDSFPPIVKNLIIINVLVYVAQLTIPNLTLKIMMYPVMDPGFEPYQIATHMFAHAPGSFFHILFNMFGLWMFGRILENVWGGKRFLLFYLLCGVGAAACHILVQYFSFEQWQQAMSVGDIAKAGRLEQSLVPVLGASGAVMGILVAFAYLFPNTELYIMFIPVPVKAKWAVLGLIGIDLFFGLASFSNDNIARFAHLGGALTGFIIVLFWNRNNRRRFY